MVMVVTKTGRKCIPVLKGLKDMEMGHHEHTSCPITYRHTHTHTHTYTHTDL